MSRERPERKLVPIYAKTTDNANTDRAQVAVMPKGFSRGDVAEMYLNRGDWDREERVSERDARVTICARVNHDS